MPRRTRRAFTTMLAGAVAAAALLAACSNVKQGVIVDKEYDDPDQTMTLQCGAYDKNGMCTVHVPVTIYDGPHWQFKLRHGDGEGAREGWVEVGLPDYNMFQLGDYYPPRPGEPPVSSRTPESTPANVEITVRPDLDEDAMFAVINLVERTGAKHLEFGYLHDDVPVHLAAWWATATYQGAKITEESHAGPLEALEALARRLLTGAMCKNCGGLVALSDDGALAYDSTLVDGTPWNVEDAKRAGQCRWRRLGARWEPGCQTKNRETRRAERRKNRRA